MSFRDRIVRAPGAVPSWGAAGTIQTDAIFACRIARATDPSFTTDLGTPNRSFNTPSSSYQIAWNSDGTKFYVVQSDGTHYVCTFNRTTMATARWGGLLQFSREPVTWSDTDPNILYGPGIAASGHTIVKVDVSSTTFVTTTLINLDSMTPGLPNPSYLGAMTIGNGVLNFIYGAPASEYMQYNGIYPIANPAGAKYINTLTLNGQDEVNSKFSQHSSQIDKSGRYVSYVPTGSTIPPPGVLAAYRIYIWDTLLDTITPVRTAPGGHESLGWGTRINGDCLGSFDAAQWIFTPSLLGTGPNTNRVDLISPLMSPIESYAAEHSSYNNAKQATSEPFFAEVYRYYDGTLNLCAFRAWDQEILKIATDGSGTVTRICHHRSNVAPDSGGAAFFFYYTPRVNVDAQGEFCLFTSNMEKSLGVDVDGFNRRDVFVVDCHDVTAHRAHRRLKRFR